MTPRGCLSIGFTAAGRLRTGSRPYHQAYRPERAVMANFDASRLKITRARTHVGNLMEAIRAYLLRTPFHIEVERDNSRKYWRVRVREEMPAEFSAIQGDAIHNLRASLDLLACELVRLNNQNDDDVYFPFSKTQADFQRMFTKRHMDRASPQSQALIHALQPYPGGDDDLRAIHDLDIIDKHQMLIPAADMVGMPTMLARTGLFTAKRSASATGKRSWWTATLSPTFPQADRIGGRSLSTFPSPRRAAHHFRWLAARSSRPSSSSRPRWKASSTSLRRFIPEGVSWPNFSSKTVATSRRWLMPRSRRR